MNNLIEKLTEIETVAEKTKESVSARKQELIRQAEEEQRAFDAQTETETKQLLAKLSSQLERQKAEELTKMQAKAEQAVEELERFYAANHEQLAAELFEKIVKV